VNGFGVGTFWVHQLCQPHRQTTKPHQNDTVLTKKSNVKQDGRNPKRVQREVRKQVQNTGIGTKSQRTLKLQQERLKTERQIVSRDTKRRIFIPESGFRNIVLAVLCLLH